jgi:hypothetical protein
MRAELGEAAREVLSNLEEPRKRTDDEPIS